jgi:RNA polymerase sigma factor (sigma-70 family)
MDQRQLAYERLIAPIETRLMRTIWAIVRDPDEAQDALQEALTVIWRRWDHLQAHPNPEALVVRICVNAAYDTLRRKRRWLRWFGSDQDRLELSDSSRSVLAEAEGAATQTRVRRAIATLSRQQATALLMHAIDEVPYQDVAAAMQCREATARAHVARARAKLRKVLGDLVPSGRPEVSHV